MYTKEQLKLIIKNCNSYRNLLWKLEMNYSGGNYMKLRKSIKKWNIDISHFLTRAEIVKKAQDKRKLLLEEILIENSSYTGTNNIKEKLYKAGLKKRECEECGQGEIWREKKISLHLEHINGIHNDHRIENLKILCPNCHATTDTYAGKNRKSYKLKIKKKKIQNKYLELKHQEEKLNKINLIKESGIDFTQWGWAIRLAPILNYTPQYTLKWVKNNMREFYENNCKH